MEKRELNRREFIKGTIGAGIAVSAAPLFVSCNPYNTKGLPTSILGKTGVEIPKIALGLGSRFCTIDSEEESFELLSFALDNGFYYWDTAHIYENKKNGVISEERLGKVLKERRDEVFLSTKVTSRDPDEAMKQIELSLKRLQTDKLDILKIHSIESLEDIDIMSRKGGLIEIVQKMKEQGVARFIGFSGHGNAEAMKEMALRNNFDTMLIAMNHWGNNANDRKNITIPAALEKGMGVMLMKAVRPKDQNPDFNGNELIRFALSLNGPAGLALGMDSKEIVQKNLDLLRNFTPMTSQEKSTMAKSLSPFFDHKNLEWMQSAYQDGNWA
ncbi:aldo/keto reductase [uncultured Draconibacterium sp.]|uniref:aldo/keto reductase n=1 Tax=uncultured Draconibacterium sp. TaxID=1573823 RepID=UPI003217CF9E